MPIELNRDVRAEAVASIQRYFEQQLDMPIGNVAASGVLGFFLEELGPSVYNQAVTDVQERLQARVSEVDIEVHEEEFQYWRKFDKRPRLSLCQKRVSVPVRNRADRTPDRWWWRVRRGCRRAR